LAIKTFTPKLLGQNYVSSVAFSSLDDSAMFGTHRSKISNDSATPQLPKILTTRNRAQLILSQA